MWAICKFEYEAARRGTVASGGPLVSTSSSTVSGAFIVWSFGLVPYMIFQWLGLAVTEGIEDERWVAAEVTPCDGVQSKQQRGLTGH